MLHITGRRDDGYHQLQTLFQLLDYGDSLVFQSRDDGIISLRPDIAGITSEDNLIIKAARLLATFAPPKAGVDITLDKVLPMGGGLGGGSSNAASTLLALNQLWQLQLSEDKLAALGLQLGADVPVFVRGRTAWAEGIGEKLQAIDIAETWYLVAKPNCSISTAEVFSHKQLTRNTPPITIAAFFKQGIKNDCEGVVRQCYPEVDAAIKWLSRHSPHPARLTGTGACIFAQFPDRASAAKIFHQLPVELDGFIAKGVNVSPALSKLEKHNSNMP